MRLEFSLTILSIIMCGSCGLSIVLFSIKKEYISNINITVDIIFVGHDVSTVAWSMKFIVIFVIVSYGTYY